MVSSSVNSLRQIQKYSVPGKTIFLTRHMKPKTSLKLKKLVILKFIKIWPYSTTKDTKKDKKNIHKRLSYVVIIDIHYLDGNNLIKFVITDLLWFSSHFKSWKRVEFHVQDMKLGVRAFSLRHTWPQQGIFRSSNRLHTQWHKARSYYNHFASAQVEYWLARSCRLQWRAKTIFFHSPFS